MSSLSMVEAGLPPGFRFHPRDDELVCDYLLPKWNSSPHHTHHYHSLLLTQVDLNKCEPWDIPERACIGGKEWYFYSKRDRKYATGQRTNRATVSGYWKATGKDRAVVRRGRLVGMRKTLVFYQGRAPKGSKTEWVMHEFRIETPFPTSPSNSKEDWVLCRVFFKNKDSAAKSGTETDSNNSIDETTSTVPPPLMDSYITFDQTHHHQPTNSSSTTNNNNNNNNNNSNNQQVPCFSIFSANQSNGNGNDDDNNNPTNNIAALIFPQQQNYNMDPSNKNNDCDGHMGGSMMPQGSSSSNLITPSPPASASASASASAGGGTCDKKVLEAVLTELTKMEHGSQTSESYLSQLALQHPSIWTTHF